MSRPNGAQGFIDRRQGAAAPSLQSGQDRSRGHLAKINNNDLKAIRSKSRSTVPVNVSSNNHHDYDKPQHHQHLPQGEDVHRRGGLDDTTVDSDFDQTLSEEGFRYGQHIGAEYPSDDDGDLEDNQQGYGVQSHSQPSPSLVSPTHYSLKQQSNTLPTSNMRAEPQDVLRQPQPIAYTGRFESQSGRITTLPHHPLQDQDQDHGYSKKRARSPNHERGGIDLQTDMFNLPRQQRNQSPDPDESPGRAGSHHVDIIEDKLGLSSDQVEDFRVSLGHGRKNTTSHQSSPSKVIARPATPDYDDDVLKSMQYTILETQSWEEVPRGTDYKTPTELSGLEVTIAEKIDFYMSAEELTQGKFYGNLSMDEWEEAGGWFIETFSDLMKDLKSKRGKKRAVTEKFEEEIKKREKAVRGKSDKLDNELRAMRAGGEDLLKGKKL